MRIAIVNDDAESVEIMRQIVEGAGGCTVAWIAGNGADAVKRCAEEPPDLVLMNLMMPGMDGVQAVRLIMGATPCAILIVTSHVEENRSKVFNAMGYGALDVIATPSVNARGVMSGAEALLGKIDTIAKLIGKSPRRDRASGVRRSERSSYCTDGAPLIIIGSSTGGPKALAAILSKLPEDFNSAVGVVQHVDVAYAAGLAEWLDKQVSLPVSLAMEGSRFEPGKVLVAGTNDHLIMSQNLSLTYTAEPRDYVYRPSVDIFFKSVAKYWPTRGAAVLLTGMGADGAAGLRALRELNWYTIAQDKATSIVYGMPKAAADMDAAVDILPLEEIAPALIACAGKPMKHNISEP